LKRIISILAVVLLMALGFWFYRELFPNDEHKLRGVLAEVAKAASLKPNENPLVGLAGANRLAGFFSEDVVVRIDVSGLEGKVIQGREELQQTATAARVSLQSADVQFPDVRLEIAADHESATAQVTATADINGEKNTVVQELKLLFRKIDGKWKITRVDTVRTLQL
jgi:ketosteroid isomerase-like protein